MVSLVRNVGWWYGMVGTPLTVGSKACRLRNLCVSGSSQKDSFSTIFFQPLIQSCGLFSHDRATCIYVHMYVHAFTYYYTTQAREDPPKTLEHSYRNAFYAFIQNYSFDSFDTNTL